MTARTQANIKTKNGLIPNNLGEWLLAILFIISPFYIASSLGGTGLDLPFNITVWLVATWVIAYSVWCFSVRETIVLPQNYWALLALPVGILIAAALAGVLNPTEWFFRIFYIFAGILFLFGLFQFRIKNTDHILLFVAVATLLHSLLGLAQLFRPEFVEGWLPRTVQQDAIGVFQQVNVMASFLVTGLLSCFYLLLRPLSTKRMGLTVFLIITITLATYVAVATGSRIGLLSLILGILLLVAASFRQIKKRPKRILMTVLLMLFAGWLAQDGLHRSLDKSYRLVEAEYADQRVVIYKISLDVIADSPIIGHGIGSFMDKWGRASANFHAEHPEVAIPRYLGHPHNELMQWAIEGGLLAIVGIMIAAISILIFAFKLKKHRAFAYLALLLPITFHTQVELPFYHSSLHWFVWLTLLFVLLNHQTLTKPNNLSVMARASLKILAALLFIISSAFSLHSLHAQKQLYTYTAQQQTVPMMQSALSNPYFKKQAEQIMMRVNLHNAINLGDTTRLAEIVDWLQIQKTRKPELHLFGDLLNAYVALGDEVKKCQTVFEGLRNYPTNNVLRDIAEECHPS